MSGEDQSKGSKDVAKPTLVGVPALGEKPIPQAPRSDSDVVRTAVDVKAMSNAEAERILDWTGFSQEEIPTAKAPTPQPFPAPKAASMATKVGTPAIGNLDHLNPHTTARGVAPPPQRPPAPAMPALSPPRPKGTPAPPTASLPARLPDRTPMAPSGRATLNFEAGAPPPASIKDPLLQTGERPPIVVPAAHTPAPKAVTQPPPWGGGAVEMEGGIPRSPRLPGAGVPDPRQRVDSVEEVSGSMLIDFEAAPPVVRPVSRPPVGGKPSGPPPRTGGPTSASVLKNTLMGIQAQAYSSAPPPPPAPAAAPVAVPPAPMSEPLPQFPFSAPSEPMLPQDPPAADSDRFGGIRTDGPPTVPRPRSTGDAIDDLLPANSPWRGRRPKWLLPVVAVAGGVVGIGLLGLVIGVLRGGSGSTDSPKPRATGATTTTSTTTATNTTTTATATPAPSAVNAVMSSAACKLAGKSHVMAPAAIVAGGVEAVSWSNAIAIGFATSDHEAIGVELDPKTLAAGASAKVKTFDSIRRVTPMPGGKALTLFADTDSKLDRIKSKRRVLGDPPFDLGTSGDKIVANGTHKMWALEGDGAAEAIRGAHVADSEHLVAFRRAGAIWVGAVNGGKAPAPKGSLARVAGLGMVGSPTIAATTEAVFVAWADRATATDPWGIRYVTFKVGEAPGEPKSFALPASGYGEQASSPSVARVNGNRFLLVWTEGPATKKQVRAQTFSAKGEPLGGALVVSDEGVFAGQGQAAVRPDGEGVVAFLASSGTGSKTFEVVAVPVACGN